MRKGTIFFVLLVMTMTIMGCSKYLDKKSSNAITVPTTLEDLQGLLDDADFVMNLNLTPSYGETSADDYFLLQATYDTRNFTEQQFYKWLPSDYFWENDWSKGYAPVYNANYCLEMIQKIPKNSMNENVWNNVKGSALFYRAYNFLNLLWNYSKAYDAASADTDLGIALRLGPDFNEPSVRASVKASYERIIEDAKNSLNYLPDLPSHVYRPSKAAAYGLLSRAYLSMREYDSAMKYADLALSIKNKLLDYNNISPSASFPFAPFNEEIIFFTEMNVLISLPTYTRAKIDTVLYASYATDDIRKQAYFELNSGYYRFKGSYAGSSRYFTGIATDELYLIRAECRARMGEKEQALEDLNTLLSKRWKAGTFVDLTASSPEEALHLILTERRKELIFRGLRWIDIKRLNLEGAAIVPKRIVSGVTYMLPPNSNYYALPLPTDIIRLSGMTQNPN